MRLEDKDDIGRLVFSIIRIKVATAGRESQRKIEFRLVNSGSNIKIKDSPGARHTTQMSKSKRKIRSTERAHERRKEQAKYFACQVEPGEISEYRWREVAAPVCQLRSATLSARHPAQNITITSNVPSMMNSSLSDGDNGFQKDKNGFHKMTVTTCRPIRKPRMPPALPPALVLVTNTHSSEIPCLLECGALCRRSQVGFEG